MGFMDIFSFSFFFLRGRGEGVYPSGGGGERGANINLSVCGFK